MIFLENFHEKCMNYRKKPWQRMLLEWVQMQQRFMSLVVVPLEAVFMTEIKCYKSWTGLDCMVTFSLSYVIDLCTLIEYPVNGEKYLSFS